MVSVNTIDISYFQDPAKFDYQAAKKAGIQTIIIRGTTANSLDAHAKQHIANAQKYGFKWHLYHDWEGNDGELDYAVKEAQELGLASNQYLFLDMEGTHPGNWADIFEQFRQKAMTHFKVGLYISESPYQEKFDDNKLQSEGVARWIANYSKEPAHYDIWQKSGAGGGGFGSYTGDVDRDVDKNNILVSDDTPITPVEPSKNVYTQIVLEPGYDTETGEYGKGYSYDNGETFHVTDTSFGRKYRQEDADRLYPYLKKYIGSGGSSGPVTTSIAWADILDKPDLVTESELETKLAQCTPTPTAVSWDSVIGKPDVALKADIPKSMTWSQITDKPNLDSLKTTSLPWSAITDKPDLSQYATKDDLDKVKSIKGDPGVPGKDGKSAYQIAVDHGFVGSEAEWLQSLHGKDGTSTSGGDESLSIEAITDLVKQHIHAGVNAQTGQLTISTDDTDNSSIADAVAAKVVASMNWKLDDQGELIAQLGGE